MWPNSGYLGYLMVWYDMIWCIMADIIRYDIVRYATIMVWYHMMPGP